MGITSFFHSFKNHVSAFQHKLELSHLQLPQNEFSHFPTYQYMLENHKARKYSRKIGILQGMFNKCFQVFNKDHKNLSIGQAIIPRCCLVMFKGQAIMLRGCTVMLLGLISSLLSHVVY